MVDSYFWFILAFVAPILWAIASVIDTYFVHGIYEDEYDGTIISGLFQAVPWIFVPFGVINFSFPGLEVALWAFGAGAFLLLAYAFYFKTLFTFNDSALVQILWGVSVPMTPFLAWLIVGEILLPIHYIGIALAFIGVSIFSLDGKTADGKFLRIASLMFFGALFFSLNWVLGRKAYQLSDDFWSIYLMYCLGSASLSLLLLAHLRGARKKVLQVFRLSRKYFIVFFASESLAVAASVTSQKAVSIAPAVSFIALIESLTPLFVIGISFALLIFAKRLDWGKIASAYENQLSHPMLKLVAIALISIGIYIIS